MPAIRLSARIENLERLIQFVSGYAEKQGLTAKRIAGIELAVEEALVNIFHYAYPDDVGDLEVICKSDNNNGFIIDIIDMGIPFNPLSRPEPDVAEGISERKVGGLGIFLIKKLVDNSSYRRDKGKNILSLIIHDSSTAKQRR